MPASNRLAEDDREDFDALFKVLTNIDPDEAQVGEDGFLFIPPSANLGEKPKDQRRRMSELAGPNGWRNHIVNDEYAGWWIRRPSVR